MGQPMSDELGYPTTNQVNKLIEIADNPRDKLLIILLSRTGRRVSELLELKPRDINYENKTIKWRILKKKDKNHKADIPADEYTLKVLAKYIKFYNIEYEEKVFKIKRCRVFNIVRRLGKLAGVETIGSKRIHPHHFRHYYAMILAQKSKTPMDIEIVKELLQHGDINTTIQYFKMGGKKKRELITRAFSP